MKHEMHSAKRLPCLECTEINSSDFDNSVSIFLTIRSENIKKHSENTLRLGCENCQVLMKVIAIIKKQKSLSQFYMSQNTVPVLYSVYF